MAIHPETLDRDTVLNVVDETVTTLQRDDAAVRLSACDALGIGSDEWAACRDGLIEQLQDAEEWAEREEALVEGPIQAPPVDSDHGPDFIPSHPTLALIQSAMDEHLDDAPNTGFHRRDPKWISVLYQKLRARARGKAPFKQHERAEDFRFDLPERGSVALVSDWGTGNAHAAAVARQIAARQPDHVIHLGDVYYSGTPREQDRNFLSMWRAYGPPAARYWALNANHDMYSGGYGYFQHVLPAFGQPASYFALRNRHWQLLGLDSAYINHNFNGPQMEWLEAQWQDDVRSILLTHHHWFSPYRKRGDALEEWLDPALSRGQLWAWLWGHDHYLMEFADCRGVKCRLIGHGSLPYVPPDRRRQRHPVEIVRWESRPSPATADRGMHGFVHLMFDGRDLRLDYVDEAGGLAWSEEWHSQGGR